MKKTHETNKKITIRTAPNFGYQLAGNLGIRLEKDKVMPTRWPVKFPITIKQVANLPEVGKNIKVARKIIEAARAMWKNMRAQAVEIEKDMLLHPEYYDIIGIDSNNDIEETAWRHLSIELEQIAGYVFVTDFENEEAAKSSVYKMLGATSLKKYMIEFGTDYKNFIDEVREIIRNTKEILPSIRLELICLLNVNTKAAKKLKKQTK